jgi:exodeoxyribonuclease V alpha subunit
MLQRNLLYTGITRGKRLVVLVGQKKAIAIVFATFRGGDAGRNLTNGFGSARPPDRRICRRLIEMR